MTDVLLKREELIHNATKDIDLKDYRKYKIQKDRLDAELMQVGNAGGDTTDVNSRLEKLNDSFLSNNALQSSLELYKKKSELCLTGLFTDEQLIKKVVPEILTEKPEIDYDDDEAFGFVVNVLTNFFLSANKS